jgi:hypothetical protein
MLPTNEDSLVIRDHMRMIHKLMQEDDNGDIGDNGDSDDEIDDEDEDSDGDGDGDGVDGWASLLAQHHAV